MISFTAFADRLDILAAVGECDDAAPIAFETSSGHAPVFGWKTQGFGAMVRPLRLRTRPAKSPQLFAIMISKPTAQG